MIKPTDQGPPDQIDCFGVQLDAIGGSLGGGSLTVGAGHLFWRNPGPAGVGIRRRALLIAQR